MTQNKVSVAGFEELRLQAGSLRRNEIVKVVSVAGFEELRLQAVQQNDPSFYQRVSVAGFEELRLQDVSHARYDVILEGFSCWV